MSAGGFQIAVDFVHLDTAGGASVLPGFEWSPEYLEAYAERFAADDGRGRTVGLLTADATWTVWEMHPAGDELLVALAGSFELVQETSDGDVRISLASGEAALNPAGVWNTLDVIEPGRVLFIAPGMGTEHRSRS